MINTLNILLRSEHVNELLSVTLRRSSRYPTIFCFFVFVLSSDSSEWFSITDCLPCLVELSIQHDYIMLYTLPSSFLLLLLWYHSPYSLLLLFLHPPLKSSVIIWQRTTADDNVAAIRPTDATITTIHTYISIYNIINTYHQSITCKSELQESRNQNLTQNPHFFSLSLSPTSSSPLFYDYLESIYIFGKINTQKINLMPF